ncbi:hypothetical protein Daura_22340 [Dactylosporangium aurantiacum]|uniref:Uncharacterized protein n=1 Tax=Dactylosporangium aurantiacum TaxID=35754 RepID=A0A9Q9ISN5_9ACTN|nr:hypothetical protein [Dactylosporangium aurantiacum]MDG6110189.1 hypothetical protein [Dactylosporangium aurantiacum]UWZ58665.1 hypothetical protein Daura_22340 [Dactylosporangium aurantiacum]
MALRPIEDPDTGWHSVSGVARDPTVIAPVGRRLYRHGAHIIGFDDSFADSIVVRAYYDPAAETGPRARSVLDGGGVVHVGYMQFMQLRFLGQSIPPETYGGRLGDRGPYVYDNNLFVDFMGPADARTRSIPVPFYPYNGMLVAGISTMDELYLHPKPNGSLCSPRNLGRPDQSVVASLVAEIAPGLVTPPDVAAMLTPTKLKWVLPTAPAVLAQREAYQVALGALRTPDSPPDSPPALAGLRNEDIAAQLVGDYVLLGLPDPENLGDTLVITTEPGNNGLTNVLVYALSDYDMESMTADAGRLALLRIRDWMVNEGINLPVRAPIRTYGRNGLLTSPYAFLPAEPPLELQYWTVAVARLGAAQATYAHHPLSGVTWSVWFGYDEDSGEFTMTRLSSPRLAGAVEVRDGIRKFIDARDGAAGQRIDTSNFTRAAMLRDSFGSGDKPALPDA